MSGIRRVLVVGGGVGGMSLAICLRRLGVAVDLIDSDPHWRPLGAGLSLNGATLQAFQRVGVYDRIRAAGHVHSAVALYTPSGQLLNKIEPPAGGATMPSGGGILRPVLHDILSTATREAGTRVRLGIKLELLEEQGPGVRAVCTDGEEGLYDLVVGADGLHSQVREMMFPDGPKPRFTGQGCWRAVFPRPQELDCVSLFLDSHHKAGLNPVSDREMYLFLLESVPGEQRMAPEEWPRLLEERLQPFGGLLTQLRARLDDTARINYRPLETLLLPAPWFRGGVLLIGDAAHATTPHVAFGCGLAVEDAVVLAELVEQQLPRTHLLEKFMERRFERCRAVVEGSVNLGELEMAHASTAEQQALTALIQRTIAQPI
jgi:2-polyprenyl-6-methoxyphenol hydroxylase-like FAD-dependent oxidoreductase